MIFWSPSQGSFPTAFTGPCPSLSKFSLAQGLHRHSARRFKLRTCSFPAGGKTSPRWEGTWANLRLIHVDIWWKPAQHCQAIILQLKINFLKDSRKKAAPQTGMRTTGRGRSFLCSQTHVETTPSVAWLQPSSILLGVRTPN